MKVWIVTERKSAEDQAKVFLDVFEANDNVRATIIESVRRTHCKVEQPTLTCDEPDLMMWSNGIIAEPLTVCTGPTQL